MKNVKILRQRRVALSKASGFEGSISFANGSLILSHSTKDPICIVDTSISSVESQMVHEECLEWPLELGGEQKRILSMQPMAGNVAEMIIILESGEILKRKDLSGIEWIGQIKDGITTACWNPDGDLVVLVSGAKKLIVMTADFDVVFEGPLEATGESGEKFVSIGWGKKETQFHGSAGKEAAKAVKSVVMRPVSGDDGIPRVAWRGDGAFFAVSSQEALASGARRIRVFDRMGQLQGLSEPEEQLESSLAWIPNGSLIASTAIHASGTRQVIFFERNGLRHGEFNLPAALGSVKEMQWNPDSTVLAILFKGGVVGLWSQKNYYWYEKARMMGLDGQSMAWNPLQNQLVVLSKQNCSLVNLSWEFSGTRGDPSDGLSLVGVVDGPKVLLTPFAVANVPPPMAFGEVVLAEVPVAIDLLALPNKTAFLLAIATHSFLFLFEGSVHERATLKIEQLAKIELSRVEQVIFASSGERLLCKVDGKVLQARSTKDLELIEERLVDREFVISACGKLLQSYSGEHLSLTSDDWMPSASGFSPVLLDSPAGVIEFNEAKGSLWVDGETILASGCTSLFLSPDFLIAATISKTLLFFPLNQPACTWQVGSTVGEEAVRRIEAGAEIVSASSTACSLVLQAPRGNLETIYPRAMVLAGIRKALSLLDYRRAYLDCRRHRIDLNFIHDAQPTTFMAMIDKFVGQVPETDYLNLFISSLSPEDCTRTKYPGFTSDVIEATTDDEGGDKVNRICEAILKVLPPTQVEPLMTSFVCQRPPNLEAALKQALTLTDDPDALDHALTYLVWLVDAGKLFDVALGLYHLPLALSIGRRSQKDPKEYVGFLEEMAALPEAMRHFRIDDRLGRDELALAGLWRCVQEGLMEEDALFAYIQAKEHLYKPAMSLSDLPESLRTRLLTQFAGHCRANGSSLDAAASLYRLAKDYPSAFEVCVEAGLWQQALSIAHEVGMEDQDRVGLIGDLFETLMRANRYPEAYSLAITCNDSDVIELALEAALAGHLWQEASRLPISIPERVFPKAIEVAEGLLNDLGDIQKTFGEQSSRLLLLIRRLIDPPPTKTGDGAIAEISDTLSEMSFHSSASTRLTRSSTASSSRSKKKTERARLRTKPGSPYERDGLRVALEQLIQKAHQIASTIRPLLVVLAENGSITLASKLQSSLSTLTALITTFSSTFHDLHSKLVNKMLLQATGPITIGVEGMTGDGYCEEIANRFAWQQAFKLPPGFEITSNWSLPFI